MPNNIVLAKNYTALLDEVYRLASVTADLISDASMMRAGANANEICIHKLRNPVLVITAGTAGIRTGP